jgi:hypothetical protein
MTDSYFRATADGLAPLPHAHAPWGEDMLHGRLLAGLAARALEAELAAPGWRAARLTVDLFRPAAMAPVRVDISPVRDGRRLRITDARMRCDGHEVGRVTAVFLAESEEPPGTIWRPSTEPWPDPESMPAPTEPGSPGQEHWLFRMVQGGFGNSERTRVWTNDTASLVDEEPLSPFVRATLSADIACPLANSSDAGLYYINADFTLLLGRYPVGEWVGVEVAQQIQADGISMGSATLVDERGPFATSSGVSLARPPLDRDGPVAAG